MVFFVCLLEKDLYWGREEVMVKLFMKVLYKGIFILFILVYLVGKECCFICDGKELLVNSGILIGKLFFFVYMILYDNMLLFIYGLFILKISLFIMIFFVNVC